MTAERPESPVTEGAPSLEVRWIFPGRLETAVAGWFGRFPAWRESREATSREVVYEMTTSRSISI
jgi:hypothetical protein